jgi:PP-loop superfamily ATP-utilizing enzyme
VVSALKGMGFKEVALDLEGYVPEGEMWERSRNEKGKTK